LLDRPQQAGPLAVGYLAPEVVGGGGEQVSQAALAGEGLDLAVPADKRVQIPFVIQSGSHADAAGAAAGVEVEDQVVVGHETGGGGQVLVDPLVGLALGSEESAVLPKNAGKLSKQSLTVGVDQRNEAAGEERAASQSRTACRGPEQAE